MENNTTGGTFEDMSALVILIGASAQDTARLLGLETRLVIRTVGMMVTLLVLLALVVLGVWLSVTVIVTAGLYEYTGLGITLSVVVASLLNLASAAALVMWLKRLSRRLTFPETRLAVKTLLKDASAGMQKQES